MPTSTGRLQFQDVIPNPDQRDEILQRMDTIARMDGVTPLQPGVWVHLTCPPHGKFVRLTYVRWKRKRMENIVPWRSDD